MKNKNYRIIGEYGIEIYLIDSAIKIQRFESDCSNINCCICSSNSSIDE